MPGLLVILPFLGPHSCRFFGFKKMHGYRKQPQFEKITRLSVSLNTFPISERLTVNLDPILIVFGL